MSPKCKVVYVITKANWGGTQKYVYDLVTNLSPAEFEVAVVYGGSGLLARRLGQAGIRGITLPALGRDVALISDGQAFWQLFKIFRQEKPNIVHLNSSKIGILGALAARLAGVPKIIFTAHGWAFAEDRPGWQKLIIKMISWLTVVLSTRTIAVSRHDAEQTKSWPGVKNKIVLIYNGVDTTETVSYLNRSDLKLPPDQVVIGTIAELTKNKGLRYALKALSQIKDRPGQLLIIGEGEERARLTDMIAQEGLTDKVTLLGFQEEARRYLGVFDIFLLPSVKEGLPFVLLEAGLAHCAVIASAVGGIPEIIKPGETGLLVPPREVTALARALAELIVDKDKRLRLGKNLEQLVRNNFALADTLKKTFALYRF